MFERIRNLVEVFARRISTDRRHSSPRVPWSPSTVAGVRVTADDALKVSAVWACVSYISQTVAVLPWHVLKDDTTGAEIQIKNTLDWLLWKRPNPEWSSYQFRETLTSWALRWGNGYAEIERDLAGRPFALWPIHPERVTVCRNEGGDLFYEVDNGMGPKVQIAMMDMFHLRGFGEGPCGESVMHYASQSIGWAMAAQTFGSAFFGNGAQLGGVVINKKNLSAEGLERQKLEFNALYRGARRAHQTVHLDNDAEFKPIGMNADQAQLIPTHQHLVEEICRWFKVPPHKVHHLLRATFSNIEHQAIEAVVDCISHWCKRFEDEADFKLTGQNRQGLYTKMNMNALMRGDSKSRAEFYKSMREIGAFSVNRVLELEDEHTIGPDGDKHTMNQGYTTLEKIGEDPPAPAPAPQIAPPEDKNDDEQPAEQMSKDEVAAMAEIEILMASPIVVVGIDAGGLDDKIAKIEVTNA